MRDGFDLGGLGEHVEGGDRNYGEALLQLRDIAPERWRIAGDVDHRARRSVENGAAHFGGETGGRRIDDQRGRGQIIFLQEPAQFRGHVTRDVTFLWVGPFLRGGDGEPIPIDSNHSIELWSKAL